MAAVAQTPPAGQSNVDWMRHPLPVVAEPQIAPRLICELCTAATPQAERQEGANPAAIRRAIRALGSRIFPGRRLSASRRDFASPAMTVRPMGSQARGKR